MKEEYKNKFKLEWETNQFEETDYRLVMKSFTNYSGEEEDWSESGEFHATLCDGREVVLVSAFDKWAESGVYVGMNKKDFGELIKNLRKVYKEMK